MVKVRIWIYSLIILSGPALILAYNLLHHYYGFCFRIYDNLKDIATIGATYSISMLGFISVMVSLVSSYRDRQFMVDYIAKGYYSVYIEIFIIFSCSSGIMLFLSLLLFTNLASTWLLQAMFAFFIISFFALTFLTIINVNMLKNVGS